MKRNQNERPLGLYAAEDIESVMLGMEDAAQREVLCRFFKTGAGQYGEGDMFLGLKVPRTREVVSLVRLGVPLAEIEKLLYSKWHEVRLCGFLLLVEEMKAALPRRKELPAVRAERRREIAGFYLRHAAQANNWDLVDLSCPSIVGQWLLYPAEDGHLPSTEVLDRLAASGNLWEQRISIVSTLSLIKAGRYDETLRISTALLGHHHDLIHKAVGWMLRELGKKDAELLREYLSAHCKEMPRTTLRYAIEKFSPEERQYWLNL